MEGCIEVSDKNQHEYVNGSCQICAKEDPALEPYKVTSEEFKAIFSLEKMSNVTVLYISNAENKLQEENGMIYIMDGSKFKIVQGDVMLLAEIQGEKLYVYSYLEQEMVTGWLRIEMSLNDLLSDIDFEQILMFETISYEDLYFDKDCYRYTDDEGAEIFIKFNEKELVSITIEYTEDGVKNTEKLTFSDCGNTKFDFPTEYFDFIVNEERHSYFAFDSVTILKPNIDLFQSHIV